MTDQKYERNLNLTKTDLYGILKSPAHTTNRLREEFQNEETAEYDSKLRQQAKKSIALNDKMITEYHKMIVNGSIEKEVTAKHENALALDE